MATFETMDYNKNTREEYTQALLAIPERSNASKWNEYRSKLNKLLDLLAHHKAMEPNLQQTYMTPANSKNKVYFMWDFVGRTRAMLEAVKEATIKDPVFKEEVFGRSTMLSNMIKDKTGKLDAMMGPGVQKVDFGKEIEEAAAELAAIK